MALTSLVLSVPEVWILWNGSLSPLRTALPGGVFSNFYDLQARALLSGRLNLPDGSLGIEGFVVGGSTYMYFPPGPAILRMPILAVTRAFDGSLTAPSMLLAWWVTMILTSLLLWRVRCILRGSDEVRRVELLLAASVLVALGGSVLLFLASMPWVYHEAYSWSIAMSIGFAHCALGVMQRARVRNVAAMAAFAVGAMLVRTTAGWACATGMLVMGLWAIRGRLPGNSATARVGLVPAALVTLLIGSGINLAKFNHPLFFPLQSQVWTGINEHRREALAANGGGLFGLRMPASTLPAYFRPDGIRFLKVPPYVSLPAEPPRARGGAFLDQTYRTGSIIPFMPLLFTFALWGVVGIARFAPRSLRRSHARAPTFTGPGRGAHAFTPDQRLMFRLAFLGPALIPVAIVFYGYIAFRYTGDFLPGLVVLAAIGATDVASRWSTWSRLARRPLAVLIVAMGSMGLVANGAAALTTERLSNPGPSLDQYLGWQSAASRFSGRPLADLVRRSPVVPPGGGADEIVIVADCHLVLVGTGEPLTPWVVADARPWVVAVTLSSSGAVQSSTPPPVELGLFRSHSDLQLILERSGTAIRLAFRDTKGTIGGDWFQVPSGRFDVRVFLDRERGHYVVTSPSKVSLRYPAQMIDKDWQLLPVTWIPSDSTSAWMDKSGGYGPAPSVCADVASAT